MRYRNIAGRLRQLGLKQNDLAAALHLSGAAVSHRMNGLTPWTCAEMYRVLEVCRAKPEEMHLYFPDGGRAHG